MKRSVMMTMGKTTQPLMMPAEETIAWLESKCIRYELCDTPVPVSVSKVSCGLPSEIGDYMIEEYHDLPGSAVRLHPVMDVPATGDSMIEADIEEDDMLRLELGAIPSDGDIVMAGIDGRFLAKVFFTDDKQRKWLLPRNKHYKPILLTAESDVRISGVVRHVTKKIARQSYSECMAILSRAEARRNQESDVFGRLEQAVREGSHLFWAASAWAVAYCVLRDCCGYDGSMKEFDQRALHLHLPPTFRYECSAGTVQRTISNHPYMRLHIDKWRENGASVREIVLKEFLVRYLL